MTPDEEQRIRDLPALIINEKDGEKAKQLSLELLSLLKKADEFKFRAAFPSAFHSLRR
jgi:hypothetical protein